MVKVKAVVPCSLSGQRCRSHMSCHLLVLLFSVVTLAVVQCVTRAAKDVPCCWRWCWLVVLVPVSMKLRAAVAIPHVLGIGALGLQHISNFRHLLARPPFLPFPPCRRPRRFRNTFCNSFFRSCTGRFVFLAAQRSCSTCQDSTKITHRRGVCLAKKRLSSLHFLATLDLTALRNGFCG